jgi:hypothetical protein
MTFLVGGAALATVALIFALRPGWTAALPPQLVGVAAAAGAVALASGDAAPTGWAPLDLAASAAIGAIVVLSAARLAVGWTLWPAVIVTAGLVVGDAGGWALVGVVGVGAALASVISGGRQPVLQAAATAAVLAPLGHLSWPVATGASSLLAAAAIVPVVLAGITIAPPRVRRALPWAVTALILIGIGGSIAGGLAALGARSDVDRAVAAAVAGLDQADADDPAPAVAKLREAAASFDLAEGSLRAWWARPALLVPGVAQQSRAVATMADAGAELARSAATSLEEVDLDTLHPVAGRIDPVLIAAVEPALSRALTSLRSADRRLADARSPLLLSPVASRLEDLAAKVADARSTAETASAALDVAPELLGVDGPQRFFLAMQTPSELRGVGGFMGSWGELVIDDGRFDLVRTGRLRELTDGGPDPAARRIEGQPEFVAHWGEGPARYWGLIGFSPDFPTVGAIITQLYPESGGSELDGVIALDPAGFAALLELTGPITVEGFSGELTPENAEQVLLHDQYLDNDQADREAFLEAAIRTLFDHLTSGDLPGPRVISAALAPMVDGRHVQLFSTHDGEQRFFESIGADGSVERTEADGIGMVSQNYDGNKIDYFLRRSLTYDVTWDPDTGAIEGTVEVRLENLAPATGLPHAVIGWGGDLSANQLPVADGENLAYVSLYSAAPLSDITVDGEPAEVNRAVSDLGYQAYDVYVRIPSQGVKAVRARVRGQIEPGRRYAVEVLRQTTATPDQLTVRVAVPPGWKLVPRSGTAPAEGGSTAVLQVDASAPVALALEAEPVERTLLERLRGR